MTIDMVFFLEALSMPHPGTQSMLYAGISVEECLSMIHQDRTALSGSLHELLV
jgi:hypothetical protein